MSSADVRDGQQPPPEKHEMTFHITVNGTPEVWHHKQINYEQAVKLAFPQQVPGADIRYSVSWTKPDGTEGALRPGQHVDVVEGMMFDVRNTDKS